VTSLRVKEGDRVGAGQLLMTIDDRDTAQRVKAAEKGLEAAKQDRALEEITYQRYKKLFDGKAISQQEIDQVETKRKIADIEYERAKAMLAETRINHGFARISSPVSGVVTEKKIEVGSMAVPGMPLLTVENNSAFTVEANLDESLSPKLRTGMAVDVMVDSIGRNINGRIAELVPSVDPMSRTFLVKVEIRDGIRNSGLRSGLYAKVRIPTGRKEAIVVPEKAVVEKGQLTGVYAVDSQGIVAYRLVRTGKKYGDSVEILSGINPNDRIITDGISRAVDGGIIAGVKK
ncbi:MAG TPA: efflux RND transporter periplasmic adaptor subunit, partial [Dissulfurispiraceae bacterium]